MARATSGVHTLAAGFILLLLATAATATAAAPAPATGTPLQVWPCSATSAFQSWSLQELPFPRHNVRLGGAAPSLPYTGLNLNTLGFSNSTGGVLNVWLDSPTNPYGQDWGYANATQQLVSGMNGLCAGASNASGVLPAGTAIVQVPCSNGAAATWALEAATGLLRWALDPTLCLDAGSAFTCATAASGSSAVPAYCNASLPPAARVADLRARMLPTEKAAFLSASNNGVPRLGVPPLRYGEALHGVLSGCGAAAPATPTGFASTGCPTSFPTGLALGSTFNRTLWRAVGEVIGTEARALFNQGGIAQPMLFTPDINPFRDPRWGRGMEVPSEDPMHAAEYAAAYIAGLQGEDGTYLRAVAMPKHGFAYDQEGNFGASDRTHFCAPVTLQSLVEYHWPPFRAAIMRGRAGGLMCSANGYGVDGAPGQASCAHGDFNTGIVRGEWGFEGAIVTDGNGVGYLWSSYGPGRGAVNCGASTATGPTSAVRVGLAGGVDVELGETLNNYALAAIEDGNITMGDIDAALGRTLQYLFKLGLMDPAAEVPYASLGAGEVDTEGARALAREAAAQAVVLLRNGAGLIPLAAAQGLRLAVIGPSADSADIMLANYHGENRLAAAHTPLAALRAAAAAAGAAVLSAPGCDTVLCQGTAGFPAALAAAAAADVVLYFGGGGPWRGGAGAFNATEGEEYDRSSLALPGAQEALITALLGSGKPVVVVLLRGGPIALSPALLADPRLHTLLDVCYPGELGGEGLAAVLLGAVAPSGRLATTIYPADFTASRNLTDYNMSSGQGVTHLYYTGTPLFEYGLGLSTTTWALAWEGGGSAAAAARTLGPLDARTAQPYAVNVTNTGQRTSDISILAFITPSAAAAAQGSSSSSSSSSSSQPPQPLKRLFDFARAASVAPGASVMLYFTATAEAASAISRSGERSVAQGEELAVSIGAPGEHMLHTWLRIETGGAPRRIVSPAVAV